MKENKPGRYQKIMARPDKKRPHYLRELQSGEFEKMGDCLVLSVKVLTPSNSTMTISWSERIADDTP
jgi:hypothetical protein